MKKKALYYVCLIFVIAFTIFTVPKNFQTDTLFDISLGKEILINGISDKEPLTWHELKFPNPRWLLDIVFYKIYNNAGFDGIYIFVLIFAALQMSVYYWYANKITNKNFMSLITTLLITICCGFEFAARGQIISFLVCILGFCVIDSLVRKKSIINYIILAIIPFVLVNFHGSVYPLYFLLFMPYIGNYVLSKLPFINFDKDDSKLLIEKFDMKPIIFGIIFGILAGFSGPYFLSPFTYMFKTLNCVPGNFISEMQVVNIMEVTYILISVVLVIGILIFKKSKIRVADAFFIIGFLLLALNTNRALYYYYLISSLCILRFINDTFELNKIEFNFNKYVKYLAYGLVMIYVTLYSISNYINNLSIKYFEEDRYPIGATEYILENIDYNNIRLFNGFDTGSYIEFNGIPAFMDCRAEIYTEALNEDCDILQEYVYVLGGAKTYQELFDKYDITHALLKNDELICIYLARDDDWVELYKDDSYSVYEKIR